MSKKIMIIDDEEAMCRILKQILEGEGYEVKTRNEGLLALDEIKQDSFNLVITDVSMPNLSGIEILAQVKQFKPDLPVIFVTGSDVDAILKEALQLGLDGFIEKPFNIQAVLEVIKEKLSVENVN
ncbi:MAG: response regulator [Candidatus Margulisiibacteriota bacterium]